MGFEIMAKMTGFMGQDTYYWPKTGSVLDLEFMENPEFHNFHNKKTLKTAEIWQKTLKTAEKTLNF